MRFIAVKSHVCIAHSLALGGRCVRGGARIAPRTRYPPRPCVVNRRHDEPGRGALDPMPQYTRVRAVTAATATWWVHGGRGDGLCSRMRDRGSGIARTPVIAIQEQELGQRTFLSGDRHTANRRAPSFLRGRCPVLGAWTRAEHYRGLAEECHRLAATSFSTQMRNRYSRMAENYCALAAAEGAEHASLRRLAASIDPA
jgi:hypothetical protein